MPQIHLIFFLTLTWNQLFPLESPYFLWETVISVLSLCSLFEFSPVFTGTSDDQIGLRPMLLMLTREYEHAIVNSCQILGQAANHSVIQQILPRYVNELWWDIL